MHEMNAYIAVIKWKYIIHHMQGKSKRKSQNYMNFIKIKNIYKKRRLITTAGKMQEET